LRRLSGRKTRQADDRPERTAAQEIPDRTGRSRTQWLGRVSNPTA
jgi:hypothetical protein